MSLESFQSTRSSPIAYERENTAYGLGTDLCSYSFPFSLLCRIVLGVVGFDLRSHKNLPAPKPCGVVFQGKREETEWDVHPELSS